MTSTLRKTHQSRERESICDVVQAKDAGGESHDESALPLDVVDYLHFRATIELFRLATPQIQWRSSSSMSRSRFDDLSICPLFVSSSNDRVFTFLHPKHGLEYKYTINFPQVEPWCMNYEICCSKDGWLLLVAVNKTFQFFYLRRNKLEST